MIDPNEFYTLTDVMNILKASRSTVYKEISNHRLLTVMRGRRRLVTGQQLIDYRLLCERETIKNHDSNIYTFASLKGKDHE